jgi:hypothetical protein
MPRIQQNLRYSPDFFAAQCFAQYPRQYALHISIDNRDGFTKRNARDSVGGVTSNAR